jgi:HAE1 family hydrophobic/amphiphilic exporter-1
MMTTMAALMGTLPIALGFGAGAEARRALGVSVVGGLFFSQIVTLFLTPVVYINLDNAGLWISRLLARKRGAGFDVASSSDEAMSTMGHD